ncbi:MAG: hypothetical protein CR968_00380 [Flavobacteriia bacterium]|nr:MAG: hypothetical protein CR968_00380 [Flavobacteriia bacterium]
MSNFKKYIFTIALLLISASVFGQGSGCEDASPFCAGGTKFVFENRTDNVNYGKVGCLFKTPNPAWFYMKINKAGKLDFKLTQGDNTPVYDNLDVDFICWGPFNAPNCDDLQYFCLDAFDDNVIACSYLPDPVEYFSINNAQVGEYYMLLITNFSLKPGFITLTQTNFGEPGAGETDCSFINEVNVCYDNLNGETVDLDATTNSGVTYKWVRDGVLLPETGPVLYDITPPDASYYALVYDAGGVLIKKMDFNVKFWTMPTYDTPPDLSICDSSSDGNYLDGIYDDFDLEAQRLLILDSQTDINVSFYESQSDAETGDPANAIDTTVPYQNITPYNQTIYFRVENAVCYGTGEFQLEVYSMPVYNLNLQNIELCDSEAYGTNTDGIETFDISGQTAVVHGSYDPDLYNVSYHINQADADAGTNAIPGTYTNTTSPNTQTIYVRVEESGDQACHTTFTFDLIVNPLPVLNANVNLKKCDDNALDGITNFDLTEAYSLLSDDASQVTFAVFTTETDAQNNQNPIQTPDNYLIGQPHSDTVWARVTNSNGCSNVMPFTLEVLDGEIDTDPLFELPACESSDGDVTNNIAIFNLNDAYQMIADDYGNSSGLIIVLYENLNDAIMAQNPITQLDNYSNTTTNTIFYRVENSPIYECQILGFFDLQVIPVPEPAPLPDNVYVCLGEEPTLIEPLTLNPEYTYQWTDDSGQVLSNDFTLETEQGGVYTVTVTDTYGCTNTSSMTALESQESLLETNDLYVTHFNNLNTLTIPTGIEYGIGDYVYSLDPNGPFTTTTTFNDLIGGDYTLYVQDLKGCNLHEVNFSILDYMRFFTPNNDGYNDYWNVLGTTEGVDLVIHIFDRYGKLIAKVNPQDQGWDGTFNGVPLPATDYWFRIQMENGTEKTGHFTLKR